MIRYDSERLHKERSLEPISTSRQRHAPSLESALWLPPLVTPWNLRVSRKTTCPLAMTNPLEHDPGVAVHPVNNADAILRREFL